MSTMIERVATALRGCDPSAGAPYEVAASAVIEAMLVPTAAMKRAVLDIGGPQALAYALASWPTMINAALKEEA